MFVYKLSLIIFSVISKEIILYLVTTRNGHVDVAESLQGSTFYIYAHFWACQTCWGNSKAGGIETLVVQEQAFKAHRGR